MVKHNRRYKDSVFVDFFGEDKNAKENFLSLYNALHGTHLDCSADLKRLRLEQVMYMTFYNDVARLVDDKIIILVEHQSTINRNMPLRCLQYVARLYEQIQDPRAKYYRTLRKIPTPEFYVFYNGKEEYPENVTLRLSDAFMTAPVRPNLELIVSVMNINYNKSSELLNACKPLKEYTLFVDAVRRHTKLDPENGFKNAVKKCIQNDILREYLQRKSREVINMLTAEYDYDVDIAVQREEERVLALQEGEARGSHQKALEDAQNFKRLGVSISIITEATGLTKEDFEKL